MSIDTPCAQHTLHVAIVPRSPDMIHHLVATVLNNCFADFVGESIKDFVPGGTLPLALSAFAYTFQRIEDTLRVIDLVDRGGTLSTVTAATAGMIGVAFKFFDKARFPIHIS